MSDWDASRYHRISGPQFDWGQRVIARLRPTAGERILDLGCGTGRLTLELASLAGAGVVAVDRSPSMIEAARESGRSTAAWRFRCVQADGAALPFQEAFDAVFSAATLHWIPDHEAVFRSVHASLRPGGRFVAQCGGAGNLHRLLRRAEQLMSAPPYDRYFRDWEDAWRFEDAGSTAARLERAGFVGVRAWIEDSPVHLPDTATYAEFVACVCIRPHLDRLPAQLRDPFAGQLAAQAAADSPPFGLDYRRLNIEARRPL